MHPILIFRHIEYEGPGYLATVLDRKRIPWRLIAVDQNDSIPNTLEGVSGLVFMGGSMSVNDDLPWIEQELQLIRLATKHNIPVLGHCLGGQLISKALGGVVSPNSVKEIGWLPIQKTATQQAPSWLKSLPEEFDVFHWHGETFSLPPGATRIFKSQHCEQQAFSIGNTLALQFHIEMTRDMIDEWATFNANELAASSSTIQSKTSMLMNVDARVKQLQNFADEFYDGWLAGIVENR